VTNGGISLLSQSQQEIIGSDTATGDYFGSSVSIDNDLLVVGAFYDNEPNTKSGAGFIFERSGNTWSQVAKLVSSDPATNDAMGFDVSMGGGVAVLGTPWDDVVISTTTVYNAGSATVYTDSGSTWDETQKLTASDPDTNAKLGWSVSNNGINIVVGAPEANSSGIIKSGAVYIFADVGGNWIEQAKLTDPDIGENQYFGRSVAVSGNTIAVGAYNSDIAANNAGAVYIYKENNGTWLHEQTLTATDAAAGDGFGEYVSIDGDLLLVGSWLTDDNGTNSGSAYIFRYAGSVWAEEAKLLALDGAAGDRLGFRLDIKNGIAAVGSRADDHGGGSDAGSTYLFEQINGSWQQLSKLVANNAQPEDNMGIGVAISPDVVASGAERSDRSGVDSGSVYVDDVPIGLPTSTPMPLAAATQVAPVNLQNSSPTSYEWLEIDGATDYTLVVYDITADSVVFSDTFSSNICANNICVAQPSNLTLSSADFTWMVRGYNSQTTSSWSSYDGTFCAGLIQEAEAGNLNNYFVAMTDAGASGGEYIHVPDGTGNEWYGPISGKQADFCFQVDAPGTYRVKSWAQGIDTASDAFFVQIDGHPSDGYLWDIMIGNNFAVDYMSDRGGSDPIEVVLSAGNHHVSIYVREDGARLDKLELELMSSNVLHAAASMSQPSSSESDISGNIHFAVEPDELSLANTQVRLVDMFSYGLDFDQSVQLDKASYYSFGDIPAGHYVIEIVPPEGYTVIGSRSQDIELLEGEQIRATFELRPMDDSH